MKPVKQTILKTETTKGNCLAACIASILELPIESVPHFITFPSWFKAMQDFLAPLNLRYATYHGEIPPSDYYVACGLTVRDIYHACVYKNGEVAHDPHPSDAGLIEVEEQYILLPLDYGEQARRFGAK